MNTEKVKAADGLLWSGECQNCLSQELNCHTTTEGFQEGCPCPQVLSGAGVNSWELIWLKEESSASLLRIPKCLPGWELVAQGSAGGPAGTG